MNIEPPRDVLNDIRHRIENCPFADKGKPGCLLQFRPDLTEVDDDGHYWHATCGKTWDAIAWDPDTDEMDIEPEKCYDHPVYDDAGQHIADWG